MTRPNDPNAHPTESPNDPVLTPLLDEALSAKSSDVRASADLSDGVIAATAHHFAPPSDATLDPLLDEALTPSDVPADLTTTIYAATREHFEESAVLARLTPGRWTAWSAAAAIVLIIAGVWVFGPETNKIEPAPHLAELEEQFNERTDIVLGVKDPEHESFEVPAIDTQLSQLGVTADRIEAGFEAASELDETFAALDQTLREELGGL